MLRGSLAKFRPCGLNLNPNPYKQLVWFGSTCCVRYVFGMLGHGPTADPNGSRPKEDADVRRSSAGLFWHESPCPPLVPYA